VVAEAVDRCRMKANARGITLTSVGTRGLSVLGDEDLLVTALRNLLENAVVYSPERTRVVVT
jgi:two-component system sensor histidine kinase SenX3